MLLRVNSWPMGFILLAKGRGAALFWTDFASYSVYVGLGWLGLRWFGLTGTGIAFLGLYIFHWAIVYVVVRKLSGFRWSTSNQYLSTLAVLTASLALGARLTLAEPWATGIGVALAIGTGVFCLKTLADLVGAEEVNYYFRRLHIPFQLPVSEAPIGVPSEPGTN
jgi:PST family polysaccharide transporter